MVAFHWAYALIAILFGLLLVGVIVAAGVVLGRLTAATHRPTQSPPLATVRETPQEILARRFASGEITAEEYQKSRDLLSS